MRYYRAEFLPLILKVVKRKDDRVSKRLDLFFSRFRKYLMNGSHFKRRLSIWERAQRRITLLSLIKLDWRKKSCRPCTVTYPSSEPFFVWGRNWEWTCRRTGYWCICIYICSVRCADGVNTRSRSKAAQRRNKRPCITREGTGNGQTLERGVIGDWFNLSIGRWVTRSLLEDERFLRFGSPITKRSVFLFLLSGKRLGTFAKAGDLLVTFTNWQIGIITKTVKKITLLQTFKGRPDPGVQREWAEVYTQYGEYSLDCEYALTD